MRIQGLGGREYLDNLAGKARRAEAAPEVRFAGEVDRVYLDVPGPMRARPGIQNRVGLTDEFDRVCLDMQGPMRASLPLLYGSRSSILTL